MTRVTKIRNGILLTAGALAALGSYNLGLSGLSLAQSITDSRCSAGAFITHARAPKTLDADSHSNSTAAQVSSQTDAALTTTTDVATSGSNLLSNSGLEGLTGSQPTGWSNNRYGNNDATFSQVLGHNSGRAVRIDITKYTDGTADWFTDPITVQPGSYYVYTDYYRSNVPTHATLQLRTADGKSQYIALSTTAASSDWTKYSVRFFVPTNVSQILVSHTLDRVGSLETDDYSLLQAAPGQFSEPLVSVTFDDSWASVHNNALPIMEKYHVTSTQYVISGYLGLPGYDSVPQIYDFVKAGHEIASHTIDHKDTTKMTDKQLTKELTVSQKGLSKCFGSVTDFAAPYGTYNSHTDQAIAQTYTTARTVDAGLNSADQFNPYELKVENVRSDTTPEQMQAWIDTAKANHAWLILVYHQVDNSHGEYARTPDQFESDIQKITASGIPVKTMHDAYAEVAPQLKR